MPYKERRRETGKMLMDIAKYIATVGIVGGTLTERMTYQMAAALVFSAVVAFVLGFYTIPPGKEEGK